VKWRAAVLGFILTLGLVPSNNAQAIYNGTSALGSPYVVLVSTPGALCSGTLIEPQILVTAAHCLVKNGEVISASDIGVYEPGVDRSQSSIAARGYEIFYMSDYYNDTLAVEPNDIAFVVLATAIKSSIRLKLANYETVEFLINQRVSLISYGYGRTSVDSRTSTPQKLVARPIGQRNSSVFDGYERAYMNYAADENGSMCPGDSGGPTIAEYKGEAYLVSIHSGSRGPCSSSMEGSWKSTATIAGEYEYLYDEAKSFLDELKPTDPSNIRVASNGLSANISWDLAVNSPINPTGYVVKDSASNELCRTTTNSCLISLKPGPNELTVFTVAGSILSDGVTTEYVVENASNPELIGVDTYQTQAAVKWAPIRDFGGATPSNTYIEVRDESDGSVLCSASSEQSECRFSYTQRSYNLLLNVNSDLGRTAGTQVGRFSGIMQTSLVSRTLNISQSINSQLNSYLFANPGYKFEIEQVQSQIPVLTSDFIFTEDVLNQLLGTRDNVSVLVSRIIANPRKTTITCVKGKIIKKVTSAKPVCPAGYKIKK
jgi:secreted trypsin-like serine protease